MLYGDISYFAWIGTLYLIILTYQDFKKLKIDDRKNYVMQGVAISLISHIQTSIWYLLALIGIIILLNIYVSRYKLIGSGDISTIGWIFMGLGIINVYYLLWFVIIFSVISIPYIFTLRKIIKVTNKSPFMHVILSAFFITMILFSLY